MGDETYLLFIKERYLVEKFKLMQPKYLITSQTTTAIDTSVCLSKQQLIQTHMWLRDHVKQSGLVNGMQIRR